MSLPLYDPRWIPCSEHWPQGDLPVLWQPYSDGPNVPPQFIESMDSANTHDHVTQSWMWRPTGIYREFAWENGYLRWMT